MYPSFVRRYCGWFAQVFGARSIVSMSLHEFSPAALGVALWKKIEIQIATANATPTSRNDSGQLIICTRRHSHLDGVSKLRNSREPDEDADVSADSGKVQRRSLPPKMDDVRS